MMSVTESQTNITKYSSSINTIYYSVVMYICTYLFVYNILSVLVAESKDDTPLYVLRVNLHVFTLYLE